MKNNENEINYGVLNEVSKEVNCKLFGDCNTSISRRTTRGFKALFNLNDDNITDENAEHIIHGLMLTSAVTIASKGKGSTAVGVLLLAALFAFYQNGK